MMFAIGWFLAMIFTPWFLGRLRVMQHCDLTDDNCMQTMILGMLAVVGWILLVKGW